MGVTARTEKIDNVSQDTAFQSDEPPIASLVSVEEAPPSIGNFLKKHRLELGQSLAQVAEILRISERYLEAIEEEQPDILPERVYTLGFVRSYALHLKLDPIDMSRRFCNDVLLAPQKKNFSLPISYTPRSTPSRKLILATVSSLILLGVAWLSYSYVFTKEPTHSAPLTPPALVQQEATSLDEQISPSRVELSPNHHLTDEGPEIEEDAIAFAETKGLSVKNNSTPVDVETSAPPSQEHALVFKDQTWVEIRDKKTNTLILQHTFKPNDSYSFTPRQGLVMRIGNAAGVTLRSNDLQSPPLGKNGEVLAEVLLDPDSIAAYFKAE